MLNTEYARAIKTHTAVEALRIASGESGPPVYYTMLAGGDVREGTILEGAAILAGMMNDYRPA